jgi:hypothetical protein
MSYAPKVLASLLLVAAATAQAASNPQAEAAKIDAILAADWEKHKLQPNPPADDATFLRRIYLDVIGRIPTAKEAAEFLSSTAPDKRAKLIDELIASDAHAMHSFHYWADVLRAQTVGQARVVAGSAYVDYLKRSLRENKPYDKLVSELISAEGKAWDNGAIGYYMRDRGMPLDNMATTTRVFLGTRIECAQCHNHPFDKWTQMEFYQMGAFTYGVDTNNYDGDSMREMRSMVSKREREARDLSRSKDPKEAAKGQKIYEKLREENRHLSRALADLRGPIQYTQVSHYERELRLPQDYQYDDAKPRSAVQPATMMGHAAEPLPGETRLQAYARWMTSPENPRFTTVIANRLWKRAFGLALIEPLDELMDTTVPVNPELMKHLEELMISVKYDMRRFLTVLYNTDTYQRQVTRDEVSPGLVYRFTGPLLRRMTAEQMWDSFVTLINPSPDMESETLAADTERRLLASKKLRDSLDSLTAEELLEGAMKSVKAYEKRNAETTAIQKQLAEAREAKDKEKMRDLSRKLSEIQRENRASLDRNIVMPGMQRLAKQAGAAQVAFKPGKQPDTAAADTGASMSMMMDSEPSSSRSIMVPGYDKPALTKEEQQARDEARRAAWNEEAKFFGIPEKELKDYHRERANQTRSWLRASEIESPAPRGHYLREFGQSDREVVENANNEASVPQALAMMNGQLLPQILNRYSQLMLSIRKAQYPDEQLEAAYLSILSRAPTAREKQIWHQAADTRGLSKMDDLIYALLNTQQFIFIQ